MTDTMPAEPDEAADEPKTDPALEELLGYLKTARGFDFHGYKHSSLERRIRKRMDAVGVSDYAAYQDYLEVHPDEFTTLFNTILINVTGFFRDPAAWQVLQTIVVPHIAAARRAGEQIRIWSAGCASGEEAYTIAMVFGEVIGTDQLRERVKIYATDLDEDALVYARHATYTARQVENVPPELLTRYFERSDDRFVFRKDLRRNVIFGRHDIQHDAPISRIDLLVCRNTLMYFNAEAQAKILARFHFALNDGGYLLLGRAETLMTHMAEFSPVDPKRRISVKVSRGPARERAPVPVRGTEVFVPEGRVRDAAFEVGPIAQLVVDAEGYLVLANGHARRLFELSPDDVGRKLQDLTLSYRPLELRSLIEQVATDRRPVLIRDVEWPAKEGPSRWFDVIIAALPDAVGSPIGTSVSFTDVTVAKRLQRDLEHSHQELETAYEELQSTNEELESTNEELQSTVEELETTNEELQSANEELETMNEEMQSTNEELHTANEELRRRSDEATEANAFLSAVLASIQSGVVVDRDLKVLAWNHRAEDLWGLRSKEVVGQHLLNLEIGLPLAELRPALRACLGGDGDRHQMTLSAVNRRGRPIECLVSCTPLTADDGVRGVILLMEDGGRQADDGVKPPARG
ncbi:MAG TPA: CheR family methyltransferase [Gemmatimonadales bacterium]|nr:CheR family methyltransferase [Gemmatimonadales bacterium]